ncbi:MAG: SLC13 family permease [Deltaproteobacteria bacterium]|nr:SLC13 family permease [Deltaproteobacteria bacterium]
MTRIAGNSERRLLGLVSFTVGLISAFMQNIGAAALFLPSVLRIARRLELSASRLLMPMGFAAILGGTLTMVASGPLILLNDLLRQGGQAPYGLFAVTPVGLALLVAGVLYFLLLGAAVLPRRQADQQTRDPQRALRETWGLPATIHCARVPEQSPLIGGTIEELRPWLDHHVNVLVLRDGEEQQYAPWRNTRLSAGQQLALLGEREDVERLAARGLELCEAGEPLLEELQGGEVGGFAEVVLRPRAPLAGRRLREIAFRKHFAVEPVLLLSGDRPVQHDFSDEQLRPGDTLVVHGTWDRVRAPGDDPSFVLLTPITAQQPQQGKGLVAALCFLGAVGLAVAGFPLSISLLSGALAMILLRVMPIDAAYRAVDWRTVFLLAGLIPLGVAMEGTGTAAWIAKAASGLLAGSHPLVLLAAVGLMATLFSLFMSNVAATVLLVPLVAQLGAGAGVSPRALGLLVAVCASNSFVLPTHQVNALLMSPGGYRNADYLRAGSGMTLLFLAVAVGLVYAFYLG